MFTSGYTTMWGLIVLSVVLAIGVARIITGFEAQSVMSQWGKYRCTPNIMAFASMFKPKDDPRSDTQFTSDNFNFCTSEIAKSVMEVALKPVFDVIVKIMESAIGSIGYLLNLRTLASNLFHGLERIFDIFGRRFNMTVHELHKTFLRQISSLEKANAIATASVFAGLSLVKAIMNAFELMVVVSIVILVILVVLVIFLFFLLAPTIPVILVALSVIGGTAYAGSTSGMQEEFCFHPDTKIIVMGGKTKPISQIALGDILVDGSTVNSTMKFKTDSKTVLYEIDSIIVSGSHIIYDDGNAKFVKDVHGAKRYQGKLPSEIYCLNTSNHIIYVNGDNKSLAFADWEELDSDSMEDWNEFVYYTLNDCKRNNEVKEDIITSETGFSALQKVQVLYNNAITEKLMSELKIGDKILDSSGYTEIIGVVLISPSEVHSYGYLNYTFMSGATWILSNTGIWKQAFEFNQWKDAHPVSAIVSIFTESGTFKIGKQIYRDFSDIGLNNINKSYNFTLSRLNGTYA